MRRMRKTKILATLGPASNNPAMMRALSDAGADVFRINFSHGAHADHAAAIEAVRQAETALDRPLAVLADLQGPKLRLGEFAQGFVELHAGQAFRLDLRLGRAPVEHGLRRHGAERPELVRRIERKRNKSRVAVSRRERDVWIIGGERHADQRILLLHHAFRGGDVGSSLEQRRGNFDRECGDVPDKARGR